MSAAGFEFDALDFDEAAWAEDWTEPSPDVLVPIPGPEPAQWYRLKSGLLCNEVPLRPNLLLKKAEALEEKLGLVRAPAATTAARRSIIANVLYAHAQSPAIWVFYSRDRNHYASQTRRYFPAFYKYAAMMSGVTSLERAGLVEHIKTAPSPSARLRSHISASPLLLSRVDVPLDFVSKPKEVIILRDADGRPMDYRDTDQIARMRRDVIQQNQFLAGFDISVEHPRVTYDEHGFISIDSRWLDPRRRSYHRVFNDDFTHGGRWYGPFWQGLPGDVRPHLLINGESVVERDYRACHLRLLCARAWVDLPFHEKDFDPYQIEGYDRSHIKLAFNRMLNADTERGALGAIAQELAQQNVNEPFRGARSLMEAVHDHFLGLERFWCSGAGLRLQNLDADICARVQHRLRRNSIPVLSVHDSFIVPASFESWLNDVREEEMLRACARERNA